MREELLTQDGLLRWGGSRKAVVGVGSCSVCSVSKSVCLSSPSLSVGLAPHSGKRVVPFLLTPVRELQALLGWGEGHEVRQPWCPCARFAYMPPLPRSAACGASDYTASEMTLSPSLGRGTPPWLPQ